MIMNKNNQPKITGFTLVELLISMVLSLFLIGGVINMYVSSKQTSHVREELSNINDNARAAIRSLTEHIEHAGYATPQHIQMDSYIVGTGEAINAGLCSDGSGNITNAALLKDSSDGAALAADIITTTALADGQLNRDCSGQALKAACWVGGAANVKGTQIYNSFFVETPAGETEPSLFCGGSVAATKIKVAEGVEDMQFKYGVDITADLIADKYLTATQVQANGWWQNIVSVQVALLIRSEKNLKSVNERHTYQLLDKSVVTNDHKHRTVFTTEIRLRNVLL